MSGRKMPLCPASASTGFSSTPLKSGRGGEFPTPGDLGLGHGLLSEDDEDTFSLLSPIYHDSFDSDEEELELSRYGQTPARRSVSPVRCELPRTPVEQMLRAASPTLSAWEAWLVNKAKEDRLQMEKKAKEEYLLKEKQQQQEREREQKKVVMEGKIQEWLKMKREREKHEQLVKQGKEEEEIQMQVEKQKEIDHKAQQKYSVWLQRKNREKTEREKKEKEEAFLKEEQEKERHQRAEVQFKQWLAKANEKSTPISKSPCYPASPYNKFCPSPTFYNPIPWKPIHAPPPESTVKKPSGKKPQKQRKSQQTPGTTLRLRNTLGSGHSLHGR